MNCIVEFDFKDFDIGLKALSLFGHLLVLFVHFD